MLRLYAELKKPSADQEEDLAAWSTYVQLLENALRREEGEKVAVVISLWIMDYHSLPVAGISGRGRLQTKAGRHSPTRARVTETVENSEVYAKPGEELSYYLCAVPHSAHPFRCTRKRVLESNRY